MSLTGNKRLLESRHSLFFNRKCHAEKIIAGLVSGLLLSTLSITSAQASVVLLAKAEFSGNQSDLSTKRLVY